MNTLEIQPIGAGAALCGGAGQGASARKTSPRWGAIILPARFQLCDRCQGEGRFPYIVLGGGYMRDCEKCGGRGYIFEGEEAPPHEAPHQEAPHQEAPKTSPESKRPARNMTPGRPLKIISRIRHFSVSAFVSKFWPKP